MKIFAETERLVLREILPSDEAGLFELDSDPEVHTYLGNRPVTKIEQVRDVIRFTRQQYTANGIARWAVIEKSSGAFIGWSGLKLVQEVTNKQVNFYDLGYRLIRKYWGQGYASESAKASLDYGFNTLKTNVIYAMADAHNAASRKVIEKTGLHYIETFDLHGVPHDWFELSKEEWRMTKIMP
jgi:ribosomal-protein-alanine N-acetyltransferase